MDPDGSPENAMIPKRSPRGLIQEDVCKNEWLLLIVCMMLNRTSRKQVERVLPDFMKFWPTPQAFLCAENDRVESACRSLGFAQRRTQLMKKMTTAYVAGGWSRVNELPGVGEYASRSWEIFCRGTLGEDPPNDHALRDYFTWMKRHEGKEEKDQELQGH